MSSKANRSEDWLYIGALLMFMLLGGCQTESNTPVAATSSNLAPVSSGGGVTNVTNAEPATPDSSSLLEKEQRPPRPKFDGDRAFAYLKKQCDFGPRYLGSEGHEKCRDYFVAEMKKYADEVVTQDFKYRNMPVSNVIGVFHPAGETKPSASPIILLAHWDTRPIADGPNSPESRKAPAYRYGPNGWNRINPILGANDGASGAAVLLELARLFKEQKPTVGVLLMFVDGEDYGDFRANNSEGEGVFLGSRYFAANFRKNKSLGQPVYGILLDMVGGKNLIIPREMESQNYAPGTNEKVFSTAQRLGYGDIFRFHETQQVEDDHIPLNNAGIPTIDLIHPLPFSPYERTGYYYWHTLKDTPENCSAKSLKVVGEVLTEVIYSEK